MRHTTTRRASHLRKCANMRAAKERRRLATDCGDWQRVATLIVVVTAAPDGRHVGISAAGAADWYRCGSERSVRGALAQMIYSKRRTTR